MSGRRFTVEVFGSLDEAEAMWRLVEREGVALPYQTYDWVTTWWQAIGASTGAVPYPLAVYNPEGSPVLFLPLQIGTSASRAGDYTALRWLADGSLGDQLAPILAGGQPDLTADEMRSVWREVLRSLPATDLVVLRNQPATIEGRANPVCKLDLNFTQDANCHLTTLSGDWDTYYKSKVKSSKRADLRRKLRRLSEQGEIAFREVTEPVEQQQLIGTMIRQKQERFAETGKSDMFSIANYEGFYRELTKGVPGLVHLSALTVDGEPIATLFGVIRNDTYYYLVPTFEGGRWHPHSPGRLLTEWTLSRCFELGLGTFDFSIGDEGYKLDWCELTTPLYSAVQRRSARARLLAVAARLGGRS